MPLPLISSGESGICSPSGTTSCALVRFATGAIRAFSGEVDYLQITAYLHLDFAVRAFELHLLGNTPVAALDMGVLGVHALGLHVVLRDLGHPVRIGAGNRFIVAGENSPMYIMYNTSSVCLLSLGHLSTHP